MRRSRPMGPWVDPGFSESCFAFRQRIWRFAIHVIKALNGAALARHGQYCLGNRSVHWRYQIPPVLPATSLCLTLATSPVNARQSTAHHGLHAMGEQRCRAFLQAQGSPSKSARRSSSCLAASLRAGAIFLRSAARSGCIWALPQLMPIRMRLRPMTTGKATA